MICPMCGGEMKRNGRNSSGRTRWRCKICGASTTQHYDSDSKLLKLFLNWLLSKSSQSELGMPPRTFRALTAKFWRLWPILPICDEIHHVLFVDGLKIANRAHLLIASSNEYVVGCHLAQSENSREWGYLMDRIAPPDVLVCDGANGIEKAQKIHWPNTRVQRCTFHAFGNVKKYTTTRPRLQAGVELYAIAKALLHIKTLDESAYWLAGFSNWCSKWSDFLKEKEFRDGRIQYKHKRLRSARRSLEGLCRSGTLFTYLDKKLLDGGPISATNNKAESNNSRIREILRGHRGMNVDHRIKAGMWWCYMKSEAPASYKDMLSFPTDEQILEWRRRAARVSEGEEVARWGKGIIWSEFHMSGSKDTGWF